MMEVEIQAASVLEALTKVDAATKDMAPAMDLIGAGWTQLSKLAFKLGESPEGAPWKPIKRAGQVLVDTAILKNSLTHDAGPEGLRLGTNVEYGKYHQFGGPQAVATHWREIAQAFGKAIAPRSIKIKAHTRTVPARPFLPVGTLPQSWQDQAVTQAKHHLQTVLAALA